MWSDESIFTLFQSGGRIRPRKDSKVCKEGAALHSPPGRTFSEFCALLLTELVGWYITTDRGAMPDVRVNSYMGHGSNKSCSNTDMLDGSLPKSSDHLGLLIKSRKHDHQGNGRFWSKCEDPYRGAWGQRGQSLPPVPAVDIPEEQALYKYSIPTPPMPRPPKPHPYPADGGGGHSEWGKFESAHIEGHLTLPSTP
ncbi:hypothetical protein P4O66_013407, partial [Electrophorus voltai]